MNLNDKSGYDKTGFNALGFDKLGLDKEGYDAQGFNLQGINKEGYDKSGLLVVKKSLHEITKEDLVVQNCKQDDHVKEKYKTLSQEKPVLSAKTLNKYELNAYDFDSHNETADFNSEGCYSYLECMRNIYGYIKQEFSAEEFYNYLYSLTGCGLSVLGSYRQGYDEAGNPIYFVATTGDVNFQDSHS
jgi:hypothetical protein